MTTPRTLMSRIARDRLAIAGTRASVRAAAPLTIDQAIEALDAAGEVLRRLSEETNDAQLLARYHAAQRAILKEIIALAKIALSQHDAEYRVLTANFRKAKDDLVAAKTKANELADRLNLTADVLGAMTKLISAIG
ncbi:hypothetical protein [Phreatobacter sp.]|uniref:hypothetical protein n=1 Tax=Phreatobacter sp. TaxID=1966341 RepID=UPI0022C56691|nr:hypothetical protein [Phreatobacter sp.]MCZ8315538.1 hypothetical protein [Phreatobacter sp.]